MSFDLFGELAAIAEAERRLAKRRQAKTGVVPIKTGFRTDLPEELNAALARLWNAGSVDRIRVDQVLRLLYQQVHRGLTYLSEEDFVKFSKLPPEEMRAVAGARPDAHSGELERE